MSYCEEFIFENNSSSLYACELRNDCEDNDDDDARNIEVKSRCKFTLFFLQVETNLFCEQFVKGNLEFVLQGQLQLQVIHH